MTEVSPFHPHDVTPAGDSGDAVSIDLHWVRTAEGSPSVHLVVAGDLDCIGAPLLQEAWNDEVADLPFDVFVDLRQVEFCNAAGLRTVAAIVASNPRHRGLRLAVRPRVAWLMALCGIQVGSGVKLTITPRDRLRSVGDHDRCRAGGDVTSQQPPAPALDEAGHGECVLRGVASTGASTVGAQGGRRAGWVLPGQPAA